MRRALDARPPREVVAVVVLHVNRRYGGGYLKTMYVPRDRVPTDGFTFTDRLHEVAIWTDTTPRLLCPWRLNVIKVNTVTRKWG